MSRLTKIICTIGPASNSYETLKLLAEKGMNIARLNMSHGTHEWHGDIVSKVKQLNAEGFSIGIMVDTKGPEIRSGDLTEPLVVKVGDKLTFTTIKEDAGKDKYILDINYPGFIDDVESGDTVLVDSGVIELKVISKTETAVTTEVLDDGVITSRRHLNIRGKSANLPTITEKDWQDIDFAIAQDADFIALSFANSAEAVNELKSYLQSKGSNIKIASKVESTKAVENLEEIVDASDWIMVARGDLGAELPVEDVPIIQNRIVKMCKEKGKTVIVATQMLESMMQNPTPTRAEVTDIYYAVTQGADVIMMSGETAGGKYPIKALDTMRTVAERAEQELA